MQVARSGVETPLGADFNPGSFIENFREQLYPDASSNNWGWDNITNVVTDFVYTPSSDHSDMAGLSDEKQAELIQDGIAEGCYYIADVKSYMGGEHFVAIDYVKDGVVYMMDPASNCKVVNECKGSEGYNYRISKVYCYKVKKKEE